MIEFIYEHADGHKTPIKKHSEHGSQKGAEKEEQEIRAALRDGTGAP